MTDRKKDESAQEKTSQYRVFLPKTDFPMRANLPQKEPEILAKKEALNLYHLLREAGKDLPKFTLHDGPPYANGNLHIGHALNKILKDVTVRSKTLAGFNASYVPGWDCHGLPIEWKIEEEYRKAGKNKDEVSILEFRKKCRDFAAHWLEVQKAEFKRLGIIGDWDHPYNTMNFRSEAVIATELLKFAENGLLYRSSKPVLWSCVEKTALAEAETEYEDKESFTIYVKFKSRGVDPFSVVIWTTTPWTIPANLALAYGADVRYGIYEVTAETPADSNLQKGERVAVADVRAADLFKAAKIEEGGYRRLRDLPVSEIEGLECDHPLIAFGGVFSEARKLISGDFVTDDAGTGFVHIAPGHGEDDYGLWLKYKEKFPRQFAKDLPHSVKPDGGYTENIPQFWKILPELAEKENVYILKPNGKEGNANEALINTLIAKNGLAARGKIKHSYPHSWRSKAPLIYRNTAQWFISMQDELGEKGLRGKALAELEKVKFYPEQGRNRITGMVRTRPDWVVSRQRAWGVPLALFVEKASGKILNTPAINAKIEEIFTQEGSDAWYARPATDFHPEFNSETQEQIRDILDVWFDSGSTHAFVREGRDDLAEIADMYLEGSDQHRGWFQSSLLESCGTRGRAPYQSVLTHGFVLDEKGEKMSKSRGNVTAPQEVIDQYGADILRLWAVTSDYSADLRIGKEILKGSADIYRRFRNAVRWALGGLDGFDDFERIAANDMPDLEKWVLHHLGKVNQEVTAAYAAYDYGKAFNRVFKFLTNDLSAFYFDVRKDALYCDAPSSMRRRACRTVLSHIVQCVTLWTAPILCFTAEEIWSYLPHKAGKSVDLEAFPEIGDHWNFSEAFAKIETARKYRLVVTEKLELLRAEKKIGSSLEACPVLTVADAGDPEILNCVDFADLCIVSDIRVIQGEKISVSAETYRAEGEKCARCWKILPEVAKNSVELCNRCEHAETETLKDAA